MKNLIYLLTISAVLAAADQPKKPVAPPPPATLNNTENFAIRTIVTEARNLEEQLKLKREQYELFVVDACMRNFKVANCRMIDDGKIAIRELPPPPPAADVKKDEPKK